MYAIFHAEMQRGHTHTEKHNKSWRRIISEILVVFMIIVIQGCIEMQ